MKFISKKEAIQFRGGHVEGPGTDKCANGAYGHCKGEFKGIKYVKHKKTVEFQAWLDTPCKK